MTGERCHSHGENEGGRQRSRSKGGEAGEASIHFLPSRSSQGPKVALAFHAWIPVSFQSRSLFCFGYFEVILCFKTQRPLSNIGAINSGLGEDSGEPAAGQGEKMEGRGLGARTFVEFHVSRLNC